MENPRVVFAGTPEFALASLKALTAGGVEPVAVLTQPDRPAGRGRRLTASPVKQFAADKGYRLMQPETLRSQEVVGELAALEPDVMIVAAYGLILPQTVLDLPVRGCVNVHASLLPRWRGAAPIHAAILAGDAQTGISLMQMDAGLDTGPVFVSAALAIDRHMTAGQLHDALAALGGRMLVDSLPAIMNGSLRAEPQDEAAATYAGKVETADAVLDWTLPATDLERRVRAFDPVPAARFTCRGEQVKCWDARLGDGTGLPGTVLAADYDGLEVACGEASLVLGRLQRPGRSPVTALEFAAQFDLVGGRLDGQ